MFDFFKDSERFRKRQTLEGNRFRGKIAEESFVTNEKLKGNSVKRTGRGHDFRVTERDLWSGRAKRTKYVEVKSSKTAPLSKLQKKIKNRKNNKRETNTVIDTNIPKTISEPILLEEQKKEKKSGIMYFTQDTENAVIEYNKETDMEKRNAIYNEKIKYAFEKLVENIFNTFKFTYFETSPQEFQKETVTHLVANIEKYNPEKGKAFSYFSIVTKHYLIFHNNTTYKRFNQNVDISDTPSETTVSLQTEDKYYKDTETSEFIKLMIQYWEKQIGKIFTKQKDLNIANAVIELFRNSDRIEAFNKKALYLYIREISSCKTQQITKVINKMTQYQNNIRKCYVNNGVLQNSAYKL
jgi:hypothetical protein